jgi:hypothetical protein
VQDRYRFILGAVIVCTLLTLAAMIALGHVEEKSSFGLTAVLAIIGKIALDFSEWAFRNRKENEGDKPNGG